MKKEIDPQRLHLSALAQAGERLVGDERIAHFPRLLEEARGVGAESRVHYVAQGEVRTASDGAHQVWLKVSAEVTLSLICQRCLGPVDVAVQAQDRQGLLRDISEVFTKEKMNVTGVQTQSIKGVAWMTFTVEVADSGRLHKVLGLVAEIERDFISARTKEALAKRKADGVKLGRRPAPPRRCGWTRTPTRSTPTWPSRSTSGRSPSCWMCRRTRCMRG